MGGAEVTRHLRRLAGEDVPIYILTAYDASDIEEEAKNAGVTAFCQKPLFMSQLRRALLESIGGDEEEASRPAQAQSQDFHGKRLLLVEDNELNQEIAVTILSEAGFQMDTADDGKEAVGKISQTQEGYYDAVLMDIQMPVMDGYEATRKIREMTAGWARRLPILAMTANAFEEDKKNAFEAGMDGHLAKPIDTAEMFRALDEVLR